MLTGIPRDYQAEARDRILATWGEKPWHTEGDTYRSCVLNIPTSSGKTIVAGLVCEAVMPRGRFLYLADRDELCRQPRTKFAKLLGIQAALDQADERASRMSQVVVGSIQTLSRQNRLERFPPDHFRYIFVDEAHRTVEQAKRITDYFATAKVCGQTATAFRAKLKDLSAFYDTVAYERGMFDLMDAGYIVPLKVLTLPVSVDISEVRQKGGDYDENELDTKIAPYYDAIAKLIREHAPKRQIVAFLPLISSSIDFVRICIGNGITARHVDHKSPDRHAIEESFERREFQLISCSSLLSTGWDCPPADCLLNLTPTRLPGPWQQKVGRITRVLPNVIDGLQKASERRDAIAASAKPNGLILDLLFHAERFGLQGPSDLIAANLSERRAIQGKLDIVDGEKDLQAVAALVQKEREEALKAELEAAARRKADGLVDAEFYATVMHDHDLLDFEPVMNWHSAEVTDKQKAFLERQGIDPATVKSRGHAAAIAEKIWGRKECGLCSFRTAMALEAKNVPGAIHYSEEQAYRFLGEDMPFPFGKPARLKQTLGQVRIGYWCWLRDQDKQAKTPDETIAARYPILWEHMQKIGVVNPVSPVNDDESW